MSLLTVFRNPRPLRPWALGAGAALLLGVGVAARPEGELYFEISKNIDIFGKVIREVTSNYVDEVDPNQFVRVGVDAMLKSLDPYTNFISAGEIEDYQYMQTGQYAGVGALLEEIDGRVIVTEVYKDKPAHEAGLQMGDEVLQIDKEIIQGKAFDAEAVRNLLHGAPNTSVTLRVKRINEPKPLEITVVRKDVKVENVPYFGYVADGIGYVNLRQFTREATMEVRSAVEEMRKENPDMRGLIIDLRGNPGGLLHEAIGISNLFVKQGSRIVETKGKMDGSYKLYEATDPPMDERLPISVLVDGKSASASEIVAGVMQDLDRGVIVGERSFGKGLVQTTRPLSYKTQIKITTARYYTPSGRCIQAIEYGAKDKHGGPKRTPDSLLNAFKTRNGRPVADRSGVMPDVEVPKAELHAFTQELQKRGVIFDFATRYRATHPEIAAPNEFRITDELYNEFAAFAMNGGYKLDSPVQKPVEELKKSLANEAYFAQITGDLDALQAKVENLRKNDIYAHRAEISRLLREEIVMRYYFRKGRIQASFDQDPYVKEAITLLNDQGRYSAILAGRK